MYLSIRYCAQVNPQNSVILNHNALSKRNHVPSGFLWNKQRFSLYLYDKYENRHPAMSYTAFSVFGLLKQRPKKNTTPNSATTTATAKNKS